MKVYPITDNSVETIEFIEGGGTYSLVNKTKHSSVILEEKPCKVIVLNKRELLTLYQAIQEEILKGEEVSPSEIGLPVVIGYGEIPVEKKQPSKTSFPLGRKKGE